jgi:hypothetical protein
MNSFANSELAKLPNGLPNEFSSHVTGGGNTPVFENPYSCNATSCQ